jgi:putative acetyltransferase
MQILVADPTGPDVRPLLERHLADMVATSPPESVHALDPQALLHPAVSFFAARIDDVVVGCGALKQLTALEVELKSMRVVEQVRGRGLGTTLLRHLLDEASARGYRTIHLETGAEDYFAPARRLYARHGFIEGAPFGSYVVDPNSVFMHLKLTEIRGLEPRQS